MKLRRNIHLLMLLLVFVSSCGKDLSYSTLHSRMVGTWVTDEVKFRQSGSYFSVDVTPNWKRYKYTFHEDESFELFDDTDSITYYGYWYVNEYYSNNNNNNNNQKVHEVIFEVFDQNSESSKKIVLESPGVTKSTFRGKQKANGGVYHFKWKHS